VRAPLEEARDRLRRAVNSGAYAEAERCLLAYSQAVSAALATPDHHGQRSREAVGAALDLLHWSQRAVQASRAHTAKELARLSASRPYRGRPPRPAAQIRLEG
jgi:hypothetical protein